MLAALFLGVGCLLFLAETRPEKPWPLTTLEGKVIVLAEHLKPLGIEVDVDAAPHFLALRTAEDRLFFIIKDSGSMKFYRDPALRGRTVRIKGRIVPGSQFLQVIDCLFLKDGHAFEIHYWCEVCAIKRYTLDPSGICECCGGAMERRETAVSDK